MAADEEAVCRVFRAERLTVEYGIELHHFRTLQVIANDVQAISGIIVDAMSVSVDHRSGHGIVFICIRSVIAFGKHHVEQIVFRGDVVVECGFGDAELV